MYRHTCHCQERTKHRMQCHGNTKVCRIYSCTTHCCQQTATCIFMYITCHFCPSLTKFGFPDQIFTEVPNTKFHKKKKIHPVGTVLIVACGQTHEGTRQSQQALFTTMPTHLKKQNKSVNNACTERKQSALQYDTVPDSGSGEKDRITPEQIQNDHPTKKNFTTWPVIFTCTDKHTKAEVQSLPHVLDIANNTHVYL